MAIGEITVQLVGNIVAEPEIRFTPGGAAVANFRVACTPRTFDRTTNEWKDGDTTYLTVIGWRQLAENISDTLKKGHSVIVHGVLRQRTYETREGEKRTVYEVHEPVVGPSLQYQTAVVTKTSGGRSGQQSAPGAPTPPAPRPGGGGSLLDEPPF